MTDSQSHGVDKGQRCCASAGSRKTFTRSGFQKRLGRSGSCGSLSSTRSKKSLILKEMCRRVKVNTYEQRIPTSLSLGLSEV